MWEPLWVLLARNLAYFIGGQWKSVRAPPPPRPASGQVASHHWDRSASAAQGSVLATSTSTQDSFLPEPAQGPWVESRWLMASQLPAHLCSPTAWLTRTGPQSAPSRPLATAPASCRACAAPPRPGPAPGRRAHCPAEGLPRTGGPGCLQRLLQVRGAEVGGAPPV